MTWRAAISSRRSPIRACRRASPSRSASISQQLALAADPPAFSASIFSAIRWESNANSGPGTQSVTLNGIDFTLDQQSVGREGWSALNIGTMHYGCDLKRQGDRIEFDALYLQHRLFRERAQRYRPRFLRAHARPELQHEAVESRQDARSISTPSATSPISATTPISPRPAPASAC